MSTKINYVELTGNLTKDPIIKDKWTFINIASWNGKDENGKDLPAQFTDISFYNKNLSQYKKGDRVVVKGKLSTIKDKTTGYNKLSVFGWSCFEAKREITKTQEIEVQQNMQDIPWEMDL